MTKAIVAMCLWKRHANFPEICNAMARQTQPDFHFHVWQNHVPKMDPAERGKANHTVIEQFLSTRERGVDMELTVSGTNEGARARFRAAVHSAGYRQLGPVTPVIFFDDDQIPHEDFVERMLAHFRTGKVCAAHNRRFFGNVVESYELAHVAAPGEPTDYCGTGGMVLPLFVLQHHDLITIPEEFHLVEDLWLSYVAREKLGLTLEAIPRHFFHRIDRHDQYWDMGSQKEAHFRRLREMGWRLLKDDGKG